MFHFVCFVVVWVFGVLLLLLFFEIRSCYVPVVGRTCYIGQAILRWYQTSHHITVTQHHAQPSLFVLKRNKSLCHLHPETPN